MIDQSKRRTLKVLGSAGALGGVLGVLPGTVAAGVKAAVEAPSSNAQRYGVSQLTVRIDNRGLVEFTNLTDKPVSLQHFFPGSVYWDDNFIDLNTLRDTNNRVLRSNESMIATVSIRKHQPMNCTADCLWADAARPTNQWSDNVLLGAYFHQGLLHTYPIPEIVAAPFT